MHQIFKGAKLILNLNVPLPDVEIDMEIHVAL